MGRKAHKPDPITQRRVEAMAGYGVPEAEIAGVIGIDPKALRRHYRYELDHGQTKANARVAENLYRKATGEGREAVTAAIFWLKTRAGWKETSVHEVNGSGSVVVVWTGVPRPDDDQRASKVPALPAPLPAPRSRGMH
jgi:hypothetical protein